MEVILAEYLNMLGKDLSPKVGNIINTKFKGDYYNYAKSLYSKSVFASEEKIRDVLSKTSAGTGVRTRKSDRG